MTILYCSETQVLVEKLGQDDERRAGLGEGEPYQTGYEKVGDLYRAAQKEHGRCVSYVMVDVIKGTPRSIRVGWVFRKRAKTNTPLPRPAYIETWVTVWTDPPKRVWTFGEYAKVGG